MATKRYTDKWRANLRNGGTVKVVQDTKGNIYTVIDDGRGILPCRLGPHDKSIKDTINSITKHMEVKDEGEYVKEYV